jgi:hypothetical protein
MAPRGWQNCHDVLLESTSGSEFRLLMIGV